MVKTSVTGRPSHPRDSSITRTLSGATPRRFNSPLVDVVPPKACQPASPCLRATFARILPRGALPGYGTSLSPRSPTAVTPTVSVPSRARSNSPRTPAWLSTPATLLKGPVVSHEVGGGNLIPRSRAVSRRRGPYLNIPRFNRIPLGYPDVLLPYQ